jgi:CRISPR-associated protein Cmr5
MSDVKNLAKERSQFAYGCATQGKSILKKCEIEVNSNQKKWYEDSNYKSYVKKIPMMILTNGLGATFAFIYSKRTKVKKKNNQEIKAGEKENPKNGYDLIYNQVDTWLYESRIQKPNGELIEWIISRESPEYRAVTNEVLALFNWLKRFADGMIEGESDD